MIPSLNLRVRISSAWRLAVVFAALLLSVGVVSTHAQDIFGTINGTVTDPSGGSVPGAHVTITNEATNVSRTLDANSDGFYSFADLPVGIYTVSVSQDKFKTYKKTGIALNAGSKVEADATLDVGSTAEVVTVVGAGVTLQKDSGEISRVVDTQEVQHLALNERDYIEITTLVPGFALNNFDNATNLTSTQNLAPGNYNGLRGDGNLFTVDGAFNMDGGSNATQLNNVGIDFIQEVNVQTSNYSAEFGRSASASVNVVTRAGGDQYHGTLFEYVRNNVFDASPDNITSKEVGAAELRFNDFGGSVGGPVPGSFLKGKLFFFGGIEAKRLIVPGDGQVNLTLPTAAELLGNFCDATDYAAQGGVCSAATKFLLTSNSQVPAACIGNDSGPTGASGFVASTPNSSGVATGTAINPLPSSGCISGAGQAIANVFTKLETPGATPVSAASFNGTATSANATFLLSTPQNWEEDLARLDYHPNAKHSDYFRFIHDHLLLTDDFGIFGPGHGSALPTSPSLRNRPGYNFLIGDIWTPNSHFVNEARFAVTWNKQRIPVTGNVALESTWGFTAANFFKPFGNVGAVPNGIPTITYSNSPKGAVSTETPAEVYGPYNFGLFPTVDIEPADNVTIQIRNHTIKLGVDVIRNRKDQNSRDNSPQGSLNFSGSDTFSTGNPFADSLLGNYNSFSQYNQDPEAHFRFTGYEGYVDDDWRVSRMLTVELGVRYEYTIPTYTQANDMVNFLPGNYLPVPGLVVCSPDNEVSGTVSPCNPTGGTKTAFLPTNTPVIPAGAGNLLDCPAGGAQPQGACNAGGYFLDGLVRVGNTPADQAGRFPNASSAFTQAVPAGGQRGFFNPEGTVGPRVGVALSPTNKLVFRLGYGIFYDKPEGNLVFGQTATVPLVQQVSYNFGNMGVAPVGATAAPTVIGTSAINPNLRVARVQQYSFSVQYQMPDKIMFQAAYVGDYGWHELRQPNINLPSFASAASYIPMNASSPTINETRPYLGLGDIGQFNSDGYSDYNGLQIAVSKTTGLISTQLSYTYSKTLETNSGYNDAPDPMCAFSCVVNSQTVNWQSYYYGRAPFDIRDILTATFTLQDPFYRDRKGFMAEAAGGWSLSGIVKAQSGQALTPTAGTNIQDGSATVCQPTVSSIGCLSGQENNRAFFVSGQSVSPGVGNTSCASSSGLCYFNIAAFTSAGMAQGVGNAGIGSITGPGYYAWDMSMRKTFPLWREGMNLMLQVDAFNVFNHPSLSNPNTTVTSSSFGRITGVSSAPRQFQFGLKFSF